MSGGAQHHLMTMAREHQAEMEFWKARAWQLSEAVTSLSEQVASLSERLAALETVQEAEGIEGEVVDGQTRGG